MKRPLILFALLSACTPPAEPPPVETTTTTAVVPTTTAPVEPPPEPESKTPEEYIPLDRAPSVSEELTAALQENAWAGRNDILYVYTHCAWSLKPNAEALFPFTHAEMMDLAKTGSTLDEEGSGFLRRLAAVNKRCDPAHEEHDPRFCGRSDVLRSRLTEFRGRLTAHLTTARALRDGLSKQPGYGSEWNSIKGWCEGQK